MSLDKADTFFQGMRKTKTSVVVFFQSKEVVDTAKEMIALMGNGVRITLPFDNSGIVVNEKEAKRYVERYNGEVGGTRHRYLGFYEKETLQEKMLWIDTYEGVEEDHNDIVHLLAWG